METLCRICIEQAAKCTSLDSKIQDFSNVSFLDFLNKCTTLNARESDSLPQSLCSVCANAMKTFYSFMKLAEKSDLILREALRNLTAEGRYNGRRETPCGEIAIKKKVKEKSENFNLGDSFHCQPSKNSTGKMLYSLDIVKEELGTSESTPVADDERNIDDFNDILLSIDRHLTSIDAKHNDSEDDVPLSLLKRRLAKNEVGADSQSNSLSEAFCIPSNVQSKIAKTEAKSKEVVKEDPHSVHGAGGLIDNNGVFCEETTIRNEKVEGDSFHCQPSENASGTPIYILDIVKEEPRLSESTSIVAVKDAEFDEGESNLNHPEKSIKEPDDVLSRIDRHRLAINYTERIDSEGDVPIDLLKSRLYKNGDETDSRSKVDLEIRHKCNQCDKEFPHINDLRTHIKWHVNSKTFKCETYGKSICSKTVYTKHMPICKRRSKPQKLNKCDHCGKEFRSIYNLRKHMRCHKNRISFKCGNCGKSFRFKDRCIMHNVICKRRSKLQQLKTPELKISGTDCGICGKTFSGEDHLVVHMKNHLGITTSFKCENCGEFFYWKNSYTRHLGNCKGPRLPQTIPECDVCGKQFKYKRYLRNHKETHKRNKEKCVQCGKEMNSHSLYRHMKLHTNRKTTPTTKFECEICGRQFSAKRYLNPHMEAHKRTRKKCVQCGKEMNSLSLSKHMKLHTKLKTKPARKFVCEICGKSYCTNVNLEIHKELHKGITRKCHKCGKVFKHKMSFFRHMKWHTNPKPFRCEYCGKSLARKVSYENHIKVCQLEHKQQQLKPQPILLLPGMTVVCEICGKQFRKKPYLNLHMESHKGILHKCDQCGKEFNTRISLKSHIKRHNDTETYKCEKCGEFLSCKRSYTRHLDICKGPRQPKTKPECKICGKEFHTNSHLRLHMETHNGIIYKCDQCGRGFNTSASLKFHMKRHTNPQSFICENCGAYFVWKGSYTKHLEKCKGPRQPKIKPQCEICGKQFSTRNYLRFHEETHKGNKIKCEECGEEFSFGFLYKHMKSHANSKHFKCVNCGKSFATKSEYMGSEHLEICKSLGNTIDDTVKTVEPILHSRGKNEVT